MSGTSHLFPLPLPHPPSHPCSLLLPAACLVLDGWRRQELGLKEEDEEFFDELREDCDLRGEGRGSQSVRWFQPIILIVCVGVEVSCKPS